MDRPPRKGEVTTCVALMTTPAFIAASDGTKLRYQIFEAGHATRGICVLLSGQTEFIEKYVEVTAELNARGFTVAALDWRGQGGSARPLLNPLKAHVGDFSEYDDDLSSFMQKVVKPMAAKPPIALAHSMGGHILMRALHDSPNMFSAAVMTAPMLKTQTRGFPRWAARAMTWMQWALHNRQNFVLGMAARDPRTMEFEANIVTSDRARFARAKAMVAADPEIRLSGPTWGWLEAAYRSMALVTAPGYAEAITTPVLIVGAGRDRIVDTTGTREFVRRLAHGTYLEIGDGEHEIMMENDGVRAKFWAAFDEFVGKFVS